MAGLTLADVETEIAQVRAMIAATSTAQSYSVTDLNITRVPYNQLISRLKELLRAQRVLSSGGVLSYLILDTRS